MQKPDPKRRPILFAFLINVALTSTVLAKGEPAEAFLKQLRAGGFYDVAIAYLDRLDQFPGVDPSLLRAVPLEKAQTYIDAAFDSGKADERDQYFQKAENALATFLKDGSHPRQSEARLQLGKLQLLRANQLLLVEQTPERKKNARESFLAASKTFDSIIEELRSRLKEMQGQKVDAGKNPELAARRDQYRGEFLEAKLNAGIARRQAAETFEAPAKDGKKILEESVALFKDLADNYDKFVFGVIAHLHQAQSQHLLGDKKAATDSYLRMLEQPDVDELRDAKFQATSGLISLWLAQKVPNYKESIERAQGQVDGIRPNEKQLPSALNLQLDLAKAYLAKSKDKDLKKTDIKRAESSGRRLLLDIAKLPGLHQSESQKLLDDLGVEVAEADVPITEDPNSLAEAMAAVRDLYAASETLQQSLTKLEQRASKDATIKPQVDELGKQLVDTRLSIVSLLRKGLGRVGAEDEIETIGQARQILAFVLFQMKRYRDAASVGDFVTRTSPGTENGLKGGLIALQSLQYLLAEVPEEENDNLVIQVERLGSYLSRMWPNDPKAAAAKGVMIQLALAKNKWEQARELLGKMPKGEERARFERLMGQLLWNQSVIARRDGNDSESTELLVDAEKELVAGLTGTQTDLFGEEGLKAALTLAKVQLKRGKPKDAVQTLDHEKYGPITLVNKLDVKSEALRGDLYSTELKTLVARMTDDDGDTDKLLARATKTMDTLRQTYKGEDGQKKLSSLYRSMALDLQEELDASGEAKKSKLIDAFRVFLARIAETSNDAPTLQWAIKTLNQLGSASMQPNELKASGQAKRLFETAITIYESLEEKTNEPPTEVAKFETARIYRLLGEYKKALDLLEAILKVKATMIDAQVEAALTYEKWAGDIKPELSGKAYMVALNGGRPGADRKNVIWGWGKISQVTNGKETFRETFFDARYHVALCRFLWGRATENEAIMAKSETDITQVASLYPEMGGPDQRRKFDGLLKQIQKAIGKTVDGLPPLQGSNKQ